MQKYLGGITSAVATIACIIANYLTGLVDKELSMTYKGWNAVGKNIVIYLVLGLIIGYNIYILSKENKDNKITLIIAMIVDVIIAVVLFCKWAQVWTMVMLVGSYLTLLLISIKKE